MRRVIEKRRRQREKEGEGEEEKCETKDRGRERARSKEEATSRASGACSLLPDDRVHRLLLITGAPKSRIFDDRASRETRLAFSLKAAGEGNRKKKNRLV